MVQGKEDQVRNLVDPASRRFDFVDLQVRISEPFILADHIEKVLYFSLAHLTVAPGKVVEHTLNRPSRLEAQIGTHREVGILAQNADNLNERVNTTDGEPYMIFNC
jgi:hypothetical protein